MTRRALLPLAILVVVVAVTAPPAARANIGFRGVGPRVGLTIDPDQLHLGGHLDFGEFTDRVRFQPNLEIGFGDDLDVVAVNLEAFYRFRNSRSAWTPYAGGGLGINHYSWDGGRFDDHSDTDMGLNALGGIEKGISGGSRFFLELKLGLADSPDWKVTVGWTFF
jgi:hypothetical protein